MINNKNVMILLSFIVPFAFLQTVMLNIQMIYFIFSVNGEWRDDCIHSVHIFCVELQHYNKLNHLSFFNKMDLIQPALLTSPLISWWFSPGSNDF